MVQRGIHVMRRGAGSPLLFIHGDFSDGKLAWREQLDRLSDRHLLLVVDRRGYGRSPSAPKPYTVAGEARDVLQALDAQSVESAHVVGHSYGALIALEVAAQAPERVLSLHLIEPPLLALLPNDVDVRNMADAVREIYRCAETWTAEEITMAFFAQVAGAKFAASLPEKPVWPKLLAGAKRLAHQQFPGDYPADVLARIDSRLTVQVYRGEKSHPALRKLAAAVADALPGARLVDIPGAYHDAQRMHDPFHQALLEVTNSMKLPHRLSKVSKRTV